MVCAYRKHKVEKKKDTATVTLAKNEVFVGWFRESCKLLISRGD